MSHVKPNCYDPNPVWVPMTHEQIWSLMGKTEAERKERRENWRRLWGAPITPKRRAAR